MNCVAFIHTGAAIDDAAIGGTLEAGDYERRPMRDDTYLMLATTPFSVSAKLDHNLQRLPEKRLSSIARGGIPA